MLNANDMKLRADGVNRLATTRRGELFQQAVNRNIVYLERAIVAAANKGLYEAQSDNLCSAEYDFGVSLDEQESRLTEALYKHFVQQGFRCSGRGCNYLTVSWGC